MIGYIYSESRRILRHFRCDLIERRIPYYLYCGKRRNSCLIVVKLKSKITNQTVFSLRIKLRNIVELNNLDFLLSDCLMIVNPHVPSNSPEY